ncbi:Transcriptional regulator [Candidatus Terasakiella magnetica]|nr:Transcriptional regulator [Candidatus Terasakiella magnetica]
MCCGPGGKSIYFGPVNQPYFDIIRLIERLHRHFLDVLRTELRRLGTEDINAVQALLLYNIGENEVVIRDLKDRGYYQGSNVSYNIKALTECGYLMQERSPHDRRSVRLKLTDKGMTLCTSIRKLQNDLAAALGDDAETQGQLGTTRDTMQRLERTWTDFVQYGRIRGV